MKSLSSKVSYWLDESTDFDSPHLIFFKEDILRRAEEISKFCQENDIELFFAVKSCGHPHFLDLIHDFVDGFDVSNENEYQLVSRYGRRTSFYNPAPNINYYKFIANLEADVITEECSSLYKSSAGLEILRVDPTRIFKDKTQSRFGCPVENLLSTKDLDGAHFHIRELYEYQIEDFLMIMDRILHFAPQIKLVNLGGGWHKLEEQNQHFKILKTIRHTYPHLRLRIEPGRYFSYNTGCAVGRIHQIQKDQNRLTTNISSLVHLNWCEPKLQTGCDIEDYGPIHIFGPTCFEHDKIGNFKVDKNWWRGLRLLDPILFSGLSTYVIQRQTQFNGIESAKVIFV